MSYAALWVKSDRSFLVGASSPEELVDRAADHGLGALALTDHGGVYGAVRAHIRARERGIKLLLGAEMTLAEPPLPFTDPSPSRPLAGPRLVLLAQDLRGWAALAGLISRAHAAGDRGQHRLHLSDLEAAAAAPLIALCGDPWLLRRLYPSFGDRLYARCARHYLPHEPAHEAHLRDAAARLGVAPVAAVEVLYHDRQRRRRQDVVTAIRHGRSLAEIGALTRANDEHELGSTAAMRALFADDLSALSRTLEIADRCDLNLSQITYRYPSGRLPDGSSEADWLRQLALAGARERYSGRVPAGVLAQIDRELTIIHELDYGGYFLTMREIVDFCRSRGILCQGRGSAANSIVCYCLGITAIDPIRMDLLFERFLSRERAEPPDIDLDIEHERRDEVIHFVYSRYGRRCAAMVASVTTYRPRSALREIGKALGLPLAALDRAAKRHDSYGDAVEPTILSECGIDPKAPLGGHLIDLCGQLIGSPRHLASHPCGFLLGHEPIDTIVPIEPGARPGRTIIQWDKDDIEELRLFKVDLLGLGALSHLRRCFELVREHHGVNLTIAQIPADDPETYAMLRRADTVGVFQVESRAQMAMLPRLRPANFYDLVIELSLVRPGPIQGDMVHPYLRRRAGDEPVVHPHPDAERVLAKTLGVPLFQEQVMRLAMLLADYSPGEADRLRRDMGAFRTQGRIEEHRARIIDRMVARGVDLADAERLFGQIRGFGEYGFPESHAASFALIAYASAYMRCHHLPAFVCALLNAQPMGFYAPATIIEDAKRHGLEVTPIDVQHSAWECAIERGPRGPAIRMGLAYVRGLDLAARLALTKDPGPYDSLEDFVRRTALDRAALHALAEAGAFRSFKIDRRAAIWRARGLAAQAGDRLALGEPDDLPLFAPLSRPEAVLWDYRRSGHSAHGHPLAALRPALTRLGITDSAAVRRLSDGAEVELIGLVTCRQRPPTAGGVTFYTLEDEHGMVNVIVWARIFDRHAQLARAAPILGISGAVQVGKDGVTHVIAAALWDPMPQLQGDRADAPPPV